MQDWLWLVVVGTAIWVAFDTSQLGVRKGVLGGGFVDMGPLGWTLSVLLLWILGFPAYLATRPRYVAAACGSGPVSPVSGTSPAGWYADPLARHETRYWDGTGWTENVQDAGVPAVDPLQSTPHTPV